MKIKELTTWLESQYPGEMAEQWDNVGLLVGDDSREVKRVLFALDATEEVIREACACSADLILTHHPMIFGSVKKINNHSSLGRKILLLAQNGIACYAMHTNYDVLGMAELSAEYLHLSECRILSETAEYGGQMQGFGRVGVLEREMTLQEFGSYVRKQLKLPEVRIYGNPNQKVLKAAICTGSGKSFLSEVYQSGADVYVTGDIDHHTALDALEEGLLLVDAGHYGTEYLFAEAMQRKISEQFADLECIVAKMHVPYETVL